MAHYKLMAKGTLHFGTVIHGTLRQQDLLRAFANELEQDEPSNVLIAEAKATADKLDNYQSKMTDWQANAETEECASELINSLSDKLNDIASNHGAIFGAHESDGSDFGFWPID